jgi:hypothetical protein
MPTKGRSAQTYELSKVLGTKLTSLATYDIVPITENGVAYNYWDTWYLNGMVLKFAATTNNLQVKVLGSLLTSADSDFTETVLSEFTVLVGSPITKKIPGSWVALQVQVKPLVSGANGTLTVNGLGSSLADPGMNITNTFSVSDNLTRPSNATAYAANQSLNCSVAVTAMSYALKVVTLTANNAFSVGDRITVAGVNTGFSVTNIDGNWTCKTGTNATTIVFDTTNQPVGTTPQTITVGTIAKCLSLDVARVPGGGIILSRLSVSLPGAGMVGAVRCWVYTSQVPVLVDQSAFTLLNANDAYRKTYVDLYPVTSSGGSDVCFAEWKGWEILKTEPNDTRLYLRLEIVGPGTPTSGGVVTVRVAGAQLLG